MLQKVIGVGDYREHSFQICRSADLNQRAERLRGLKDDELKKLDFSGWPLPDAYLIEIGRVAALWASLESS